MKKVLKNKRPSWDEYFLKITEIIGSRATCDKGGSGCVIALDNRVVATGYTGSLSGLPHCEDVGHDTSSREDESNEKFERCMRTIHAEHNAITQALKFGISLSNATMYCAIIPCFTCAQMAITAGVKKVVAGEDYHVSVKIKELFKKAGVKLEIMNKKVEKYTRQ